MTSVGFVLNQCSRGLIGFLILFCFTASTFAQLDLSSAELTAESSSSEAGFSKIFYTSKNLNTLLNGAAGIKFYNGLPTGDKRNAVLMAIGMAADGTEIGDQFIQSNAEAIPALITRATKEAQVANITDARRTRLVAFGAFFSAETLQGMLGQPGITGLHFMPTKTTDSSGTETLTLVVAAASSPFDSSTLIAPMLSPCPPKCPDR